MSIADDQLRQKKWNYLDATMPTGASACTDYWQFDDTASRLVGRLNANNLSVLNGALSKVISDELLGVHFDAATRLVTANANLNSIAALTIELLMRVSARIAGAIQLIFLHEPHTTPDESEAQNTTYLCNTTSGTSIVSLNQESGTGTNDSNNVTTAVLPVGSLFLFQLTRGSNGTTRKIYVNGIQQGATNTASAAPTGGGSGVFQLGYSANGFFGDIFSGRIAVGQQFSDAQCLESFNRVYRA